ncbi:hypothetical protein B488_07790 [Liberibacter crescens BT-1]|uniref:Uncharacterized protein n=1 Tax=Liberibacter crescens (strain BT-1) TaxID=1215343 RepID=L0EWL3_LIBCB|nr:hypothetical protein [Liberibacter crescens]AGA64771.1 hypothetical protein B488_07790 [Liberibacter crescens BT-1]AMC12841.1 hypothetical protein RL73_03950 [Liberibacter crescens]
MVIADGSWKLFLYDPLTGRTVWQYSDGQQDVYRIDTPVDGILEQNKECRNEQFGKKAGEWRRVASIPTGLLRSSHLLQAYNDGNDRWVKRWLNDSDNRAWRSSEGTV